MVVAFLWSMQACSNRNSNSGNENLNKDTIMTPPIDTNQQSLDTAHRDTLGLKNQKSDNY